jgi:hypothetical protein
MIMGIDFTCQLFRLFLTFGPIKTTSEKSLLLSFLGSHALLVFHILQDQGEEKRTVNTEETYSVNRTITKLSAEQPS